MNPNSGVLLYPYSFGHTALDILSFIDMCLFRKNSYHIILNWILLYSMDYSSSASDFIVHPVSESRGGSLSVME